MNTAIIKNVAVGKRDASTIYCESKSGNIYKLRASVPAARAPHLIAKIKSAKIIKIQHWIKIKEGEFNAKPAKAKAPRPEYKEVVINNQAARIRELQAQIRAIVAKQFDAPSDAAIEEVEKQHQLLDAVDASKRSVAAKKGWATRRANAQQVAS